MNKEELLQMKENLLEIASNKLTGYASIDRPAERFWQPEAISNPLPDNKLTMYDYLYLRNKDFLKDRALEFFGTHLNYAQLFKKIEDVAKAYKTFGVSEDNNVAMCIPGIPETVYSIYALSRIGATANMMNPFMSEETIINTINNTESDIMIILDDFYPSLKEAIKKSNIKQIVVVPAINSANPIIKMQQRKKKLVLTDGEMLWDDFIKAGRNYNGKIDLSTRKSRTAVMVYTSGTTSTPKPIELSNQVFNSMVDMYGSTGLDFSRNQRFLHVIPTWYSTGSNNSMHLPLCNGSTLILDPRFDKSLFGWKMMQYKPNYTIAPTSQYETLLINKKLDGKDLSFMREPFEGGEPLPKSTEIALNHFWSEHYSKAKMQVAYGQCECGACVTTSTGLWPIPENSSGKPLPKVIVSTFDVKTGKELKYYERGEICVSTPCSMTKYFGNEEATKEYFSYDENGLKWNHTGDVGYTNEYGDVFVEGRKIDCILDQTGNIIYLFDIEKVLRTNNKVQLCEVIPVKDENNIEHPLAHIVLKDEYKADEKEVLAQLQEACDVILPQAARPIGYKFRDSFKATPGGKRDTNSLKKEKDGYKIIIDDTIESIVIDDLPNENNLKRITTSNSKVLVKNI